MVGDTQRGTPTVAEPPNETRDGDRERRRSRREALEAAPVRFFVAGVPKAGTTALCEFLGQHPEIFMCPIKEPTFFAARELLAFSPESRSSIEAKAAALERWLMGETQHRPDQGFALEWRHYEALFRDVGDQRAVGEGSVTYWWAPGAPRAIHERFPHARFVMMLRDPVDRFFS